MMRLLFLLLFAICLPVTAAPLQILAWDSEIAERKFSIAYGKEVVEVGYMHPAARTEAIKIPATAEGLRLVALDRIDDEGKPAFLPLNIPAGTKHPLLLLLPSEKSKTGVRALVLEDDTQSFRWGTIRMFNITAETLVFQWGEKQARMLKPGWKSVEVSPKGKSRNMEVFLFHRNDAKKPLYSAVWEHREDMRQLVFVVPNEDPTLGPVAFKFIPETRIAVAQE